MSNKENDYTITEAELAALENLANSTEVQGDTDFEFDFEDTDVEHADEFDFEDDDSEEEDAIVALLDEDVDAIDIDTMLGNK